MVGGQKKRPKTCQRCIWTTLRLFNVFFERPLPEEGEKDQSDQISKQEEENADFILFTPQFYLQMVVNTNFETAVWAAQGI